ncbi:MAG: hypothetical protein QM605_00915 [Sphingobium sp.]
MNERETAVAASLSARLFPDRSLGGRRSSGLAFHEFALGILARAFPGGSSMGAFDEFALRVPAGSGEGRGGEEAGDGKSGKDRTHLDFLSR